MTHRVGPKGQVVLPKAMRERHGIRPGDDVVFDDSQGAITVRKAEPREAIIGRLRGMLAGPGPSATEELLAERRREREREDAKHGPPA